MKITPAYRYRVTDHARVVENYKATFPKVAIENYNLQDKEFETEYHEDKIILKVVKKK